MRRGKAEIIGSLRARLDTRQLLLHGITRVRAGFEPVLLASVAAALAWLIAHRVLGHAQPFFAPIAAAISLSTSRIQRSRRIVQLVFGVLLGIGIGEGLVAIFGTTTFALGAIVFVTFSAALLSGEGVFGEGMMFANQAAASAVLVVTLHRAGTGSERVIDALVGGAVALVVGVILFPAHPMRLLEKAERAVLAALAGLLGELIGLVRAKQVAAPDWALESGHQVHGLLGALERTRATARANVRVAPRRWPLRSTVDAETERTARLDLLGNAVLSLIRAVLAAEERGEPIPEDVLSDIAALREALSRLARAPWPWTPEVAEEVRGEAERVIEHSSAGTRAEAPVVPAIVRAVATDLAGVVGGPGPPRPAAQAQKV